jgi:hypothetical protein
MSSFHPPGERANESRVSIAPAPISRAARVSVDATETEAPPIAETLPTSISDNTAQQASEAMAAIRAAMAEGLTTAKRAVPIPAPSRAQSAEPVASLGVRAPRVKRAPPQTAAAPVEMNVATKVPVVVSEPKASAAPRIKLSKARPRPLAETPLTFEELKTRAQETPGFKIKFKKTATAPVIHAAISLDPEGTPSLACPGRPAIELTEKRFAEGVHKGVLLLA